MNISKVAVLGFGTMGAGIVQLVAQNGFEVVVLEADENRLEAGRQRVVDFLDGGISRGKIREEEKQQTLSRINGVVDVAALVDVDLVIEAVTEIPEVKKDLFNRVAEVVGPEVPLLTNTSALSVTDLAAAIPNPHRVAGLHFFNPAPLMKIVEVVRALQTAPSLIPELEEFVESLGKNPIVVKDRPGFLVNWLLMPYLNDVIQAFDEELASAEDIDQAVKLGLGYRQGPLELIDLIGLDVHLHATTNAYEATLDARFAPPPLLQQMVAAGYLGTKSGEGFRTMEEIFETSEVDVHETV